MGAFPDMDKWTGVKKQFSDYRWLDGWNRPSLHNNIYQSSHRNLSVMYIILNLFGKNEQSV